MTALENDADADAGAAPEGPEGPDASGPLVIVAGSGDLPARVAAAARARGRRVIVVAIEGLNDDPFPGCERHQAALGQAGKLRDIYLKAGARELCFAGGVPRPNLRKVRVDWFAARHLPRILAAAPRGDAAMHRAIARIAEAEGARIVGAHEIIGDAVVGAERLTRAAPDDADLRDVARGFEVARALGELDVGQAVVVADGVVIALEAREGTDAMVARAGAILSDGARGYAPDRRARRRGVLVKASQPDQLESVDLPTVGPKTIDVVEAAGLRGIALEAGGAIVVDRAETARRANAAGLFLVGVAADAPPEDA